MAEAYRVVGHLLARDGEGKWHPLMVGEVIGEPRGFRILRSLNGDPALEIHPGLVWLPLQRLLLEFSPEELESCGK